METLTKEQLAEKLNGRNYRDELPDKLDAIAKKSGLVVVFGASDDLCEIGGVCNEEVDCYDGGKIVVCADGDCENEEYIDDIEDDDERLQKFKDAQKKGQLFEALWCEEKPYSWTYKIKIPHATFDILEDGEKYCRGIVFLLADIQK